MYLQLGVVFVTLFQIVIAEKCTTPNNEEAQCVSIYTCKILIDALKTEQSEAIEFVRKSICEGRESDHMVCCGSTSRFLAPIIKNSSDKDNLLPARTYCGYQHSDDYFRNETATGINEFPWMAGLLYGNESELRCSGSLISNRYVLTAAHCIITISYELVGVRLGEYNIETADDCTEDSSFYECSEPPQNFGIEKMIPHPQFNARQHVHDIGLLRLSKRVQYSDYIRPICLPTTGTVLAKPGDILLTSSWRINPIGYEPPIKKKVSSKLVTNEECAASFKSYDYEKIINENHLCTKELENTIQFSCQSDSGAPVMFSFRNQWHQEGVSSFGGRCQGTFPTVYTRVVNYLDWIKENIEL